MSDDANELAAGCLGILLVVVMGILAFAWELVLPVIGLLYLFGWLKA